MAKAHSPADVRLASGAKKESISATYHARRLKRIAHGAERALASTRVKIEDEVDPVAMRTLVPRHFDTGGGIPDEAEHATAVSFG